MNEKNESLDTKKRPNDPIDAGWLNDSRCTLTLATNQTASETMLLSPSLLQINYICCTRFRNTPGCLPHHSTAAVGFFASPLSVDSSKPSKGRVVRSTSLYGSTSGVMRTAVDTLNGKGLPES